VLHARHRAMLRATLHVRAHAAAHLPRLRVGCSDGKTETQRRDDTCCEFVRLFHGRILSVVGSRNLNRLLAPASSGRKSGFSTLHSTTKL
jgi:hypothetical protein